jgi:WD40 repeat protein
MKKETKRRAIVSNAVCLSTFALGFAARGETGPTSTREMQPMMLYSPRILIVAVVLLAAVALQSCVVPNLAPIKGTKEIARITVGETSRDEVVALLGSPNVAVGEDFLVYNWEKSRAFWLIWGGYYAEGGSAGHRGFRAVVELDANAIVADVLTASSNLQPKQLPEEWIRIRGCRRLNRSMAIAVSPDAERTVALIPNELCFIRASDPGSARRIDLGKSSWVAGIHGAFISFSPDGHRLAVAPAKQRLALWDVEAGRKIREFGCTDPAMKMKRLPPRPVVFSPDGRRLAAPDCGSSLVAWEIDTGVEVFRHKVSDMVVTIAGSPDGDVIALGSRGGGLEIIDANTGGSLLLRDAIPGSSAIMTAAFSPNGKWLAASTPVHVELWDLSALRESGWASGREAILLLPFYKHTPAYNVYDQTVVGFSRDSGTMAVFTHETVSLIDIPSRDVRDIYRFKIPVLSAAFDPAWRRLVVLNTGGLWLWEVPEETSSPTANTVR